MTKNKILTKLNADVEEDQYSVETYRERIELVENPYE